MMRIAVSARVALASLIAAAALLAGCATAPADRPSAAAAPAAAPAVVATPLPTPPTPEPAVPIAPVAEPSEPASAPVAVDPLRPDARIDSAEHAAPSDLWDRIRQGFAMPELDNELVHAREQWYIDRPDYVQRMTERSSRYLFYIVEELEKRGMPTELALLPFIESAFNPQALSVAKASGMWQFMAGTGRDYDLKQNIFRDDRRDVLASTRAALDYLQKLYAMFDDWQLALAAYNWGEGSVQRAVARNQKLGLPVDYMSLKMPDETRNYVPKLQAVKNIVRHPEAFLVQLPPIPNHPYFLSVPIERDIDVALAVKLSGVSMDEFKTLNPQMNRPVILAAGTQQVLLPYDNANRFVRGLAAHRGPLATWTAWVALKTMRPAEAAKLTGMDEDDLRSVNRIPPKMLVKAGSTLLVPRSAHVEDDVSAHVADNASMRLAPDVPPLRRVALKVGRHGATVAAVAKQYGVTPAQVASWNSVATHASFPAGQTVVVFLKPARARAAARVAAAPRKPAAACTRVRRACSAHGEVQLSEARRAARR